MSSYIPRTTPTLSRRAQENLSNGNERSEALIELLKNPYHEKANPSGTINLAIAENYLMHDVVVEFLNKKLRPDASQLTYGEGFGGSVRLRQNLSRFINTYFRPVEEVNLEEIIVSCGANSSIDQLTWTLCNEGDGILVGKPAYAGFDDAVPVSFGDIDPFSVAALECYEQELKNFTGQSGGQVRALLLVNPHNPLGKCYPRETLLACMRFCETHNLHFVVDEIYALSIFKTRYNKDGIGFYSALSIDAAGIINPKRVHVLYGMSKDFSSNGFRLGVVISRNQQLIQAMSSISIFSWTSSLADLAWSIMLEDAVFLENYVLEHQKRLVEGYEFLTNILDELGIDYVKGGNAGFFLWLDLSFALEKPEHGEPGIEEDLKLEQRLRRGGIHLAAGSDYKAEKSGWYRITFTYPRPLIVKGLENMMKTLKGIDISLQHWL
ncbi:hypothetical protein ABW20_dc0103099 [Dactylellina cionopaga]|nr:hypothetical protein ABW20_dc0103099 [Dactylellina cionopaga]